MEPLHLTRMLGLRRTCYRHGFDYVEHDDGEWLKFCWWPRPPKDNRGRFYAGKPRLSKRQERAIPLIKAALTRLGFRD